MVPCPYRSCYPRRFFETDAALFQHARTSKKTHPCCVPCERVFRDEEAALQHKEAKHTYMCAECNGKYRSETALEQHVRVYHRHPVCSRCDTSFPKQSDLDRHSFLEHPVVRCDTCGGLEIQRDEVDGHYLSSPNHPKCLRCQLGFKTQTLCDEHERTIHPIPRLWCLVCHESFTSLQALQDHTGQVSIHPTCEFCGGMFKDSATLQEHDRRQHFLERIRASAPKLSPPMSLSSPTRAHAPGRRMTLDPDAPPFRPQTLAVGAERRKSSSEISARQSDTSTSSVISMIASSTPSPDRSDENTLSQNHSEQDFTFSFHPAFLDSWYKGLDGIPRPDSLPRSPKAEPLAEGTITPSLLDEPLVRNPTVTANTGKPNASSRDSGVDRVPLTLTAKVPLAQTPSSDVMQCSFPGDTETPMTEELAQDIVSPGPIQKPLADVQIDPASKVENTAVSGMFYCRICRTDPCKDVTVTACGHLFCNGCIVDEIRRCARCPVCNAAVLLFTLLRLDIIDH